MTADPYELLRRLDNAYRMAMKRGLYYAWVALWTPSSEYDDIDWDNDFDRIE